MNLELIDDLEKIAEKIKPLDAFENFLNAFLDEKTEESKCLYLEEVELTVSLKRPKH